MVAIQIRFRYRPQTFARNTACERNQADRIIRRTAAGQIQACIVGRLDKILPAHIRKLPFDARAERRRCSVCTLHAARHIAQIFRGAAAVQIILAVFQQGGTGLDKHAVFPFDAPPLVCVVSRIGADEHVAGRCGGFARRAAVGGAVRGQCQGRIGARHDFVIRAVYRDNQPFLRDGIDVAVNLHVVAVFHASVALVDVQHARLAAHLRPEDIPVAGGGLFQLEVLRDGAVSFILRDIIVVRVCTAADVQIQSASCVFEGIHYACRASSNDAY